MKKIIRSYHIYRILKRHHLDALVWQHPVLKPLKWTRRLLPWNWFSPEQTPTAQDIHLALVELGPIFVKFGQLLSTRQDILSPALAKELAKLQEHVPPFDGKLAQQMIEKRLQKPIEAVFDHFELEPLASASIAQVHTASLKNGDKVVIKVLRPNIDKHIKRDIDLLKTLAKRLDQAIPKIRRFKPLAVVEEFEQTLRHEIDLMREAANASQLKHNFAQSDKLYVPKVYWPYCFKDVMVMERIYGVQISDMETLKRANVNLEKLARNGVDIFFTQVFRDCFFHADMHPGNVYVDISDPQNPKYVAIDFGIMGSLSPSDQKYLATNFMAFFKRDYRQVAQLHIESGWVPQNTRLEDFESSIRAVSEPIFDKPIGEISFGQSLLHLLQTAKEYNMEIQPQLILLQKTLISIEGLGQQLYPQLNLWDTAKPFLEKWSRERLGFKSFRKNLKASLPLWLNQMPALPEAVIDIVQHHHKQIHKQPVQRTTTNPGLRVLSWIGVLLAAQGVWMLFPSWFSSINPQTIGGISLCLGGMVLFTSLRTFTKTKKETSPF